MSGCARALLETISPPGFMLNGGQMFAGAFLGIAAQAFLAVGLLYYLMPAIGLDLLWLCQQLADLDLPGKFFRLTGIIP
jgi:hypothetical protein